MYSILPGAIQRGPGRRNLSKIYSFALPDHSGAAQKPEPVFNLRPAVEQGRSVNESAHADIHRHA
jgi:hypothetical protein